MLPVKNLRETLDFCKDVFGFYEEWTWGAVDGGIRRDDMRLLFCENAANTQQINSEAGQFTLIWFVENADEVYNEFKKREIPVLRDIVNEPYGISSNLQVI